MTQKNYKMSFFKRKTLRVYGWLLLNIVVLRHRLSTYETLKRKWLKPSQVHRIDERLSKEIRLTILKATQLGPLRSNCLTQVMAASHLCRLFKISYTIHIGVKKNNETLKAHAWLMSDSFLICGDDDLVQYAAIDRQEA